jgi:hypothetical protein
MPHDRTVDDPAQSVFLLPVVLLEGPRHDPLDIVRGRGVVA